MIPVGGSDVNLSNGKCNRELIGHHKLEFITFTCKASRVVLATGL